MFRPYWAKAAEGNKTNAANAASDTHSLFNMAGFSGKKCFDMRS
jgi:hypothetical protein